ncbi:hypothetical protein N7507_008830 [Penicillium longicatenatum]|nr:hypothetical protein N7507_008830 [Penicillium longicatenatum]
MSNLPRRPKHRISHTKSRNGCFPCKNRRVKCDEERPICGACSVRGDECTFPHPQETRDQARRQLRTRRPLMRHDTVEARAPPSIPEGAIYPLDFNVPESRVADSNLDARDMNMHDLNLLQHYILYTSKNISLQPRKMLIWERVIPELASKTPFLMHLLLALAGLDILTTRRPDHEMPDTSDAFKLQHLVEHHQKGLQGLQEELNAIGETSAEVLFAGSMLIVGFAFGSLRIENLDPATQVSQDSSGECISPDPSHRFGGPRIEWLRLVRGVSSIAQHSWKTLKLGRLRPLLLFNNSNEDWKLLGPDHVPTAASSGYKRSENLSVFALGARQAISGLKEFLNTLKATMLEVGDRLSPESDDSHELGDLFAAQNQAIDVVEQMYMRVIYVLELQHIEAISSDRDIQIEMEDAAITSWPHLVQETFISSLDSNNRPEVLTGLSFTILAHLYLLLVLLDDLWYLGKNFGAEIMKINALVAEVGDEDLLALMEWPVNVVGSN